MTSLSRLLARLAFLATASLGLATSAHALDCKNAATQAEMNGCASDELKRADDDLNATYVAYRAKLGTMQRNQIRDVQLSWIKYRDLSCRFQASSSAGGTASPMVLQNCLAEKTRQRTKELKAMQQCPEGDVSCVR